MTNAILLANERANCGEQDIDDDDLDDDCNDDDDGDDSNDDDDLDDYGDADDDEGAIL